VGRGSGGSTELPERQRGGDAKHDACLRRRSTLHPRGELLLKRPARGPSPLAAVPASSGPNERVGGALPSTGSGPTRTRARIRCQGRRPVGGRRGPIGTPFRPSVRGGGDGGLGRHHRGGYGPGSTGPGQPACGRVGGWRKRPCWDSNPGLRLRRPLGYPLQRGGQVPGSVATPHGRVDQGPSRSEMRGDLSAPPPTALGFSENL
jgi:hypothetical protein